MGCPAIDAPLITLLSRNPHCTRKHPSHVLTGVRPVHLCSRHSPFLRATHEADVMLQAYANVARAISQFEPLFMIANPGEAAANARNAFKNDENVTVVEIPINDGWTRDWGPSVSIQATCFSEMLFLFLCQHF